MAILASLVDIRLERYFFPEIVAGGVFEAEKQAVIEAGIKVQSLMPGHLATVAHVRKTELRVLLIATALLALAAGIDVVCEPAVAAAEAVVFERALEGGAVIVIDGDGHHHFDRCGVPVAIGEGGKVVDDREKYLVKHLAKEISILVSPTAV